MASSTDNTRLDRIEDKIDKLSLAMVSIASAEEKLIAMESKYSAQYDRMNKFSNKLDVSQRRIFNHTNRHSFACWN